MTMASKANDGPASDFAKRVTQIVFGVLRIERWYLQIMGFSSGNRTEVASQNASV